MDASQPTGMVDVNGDTATWHGWCRAQPQQQQQQQQHQQQQPLDLCAETCICAHHRSLPCTPVRRSDHSSSEQRPYLHAESSSLVSNKDNAFISDCDTITRRRLLMLAIDTAPHAAITVQWAGDVLASNGSINHQHQEACLLAVDGLVHCIPNANAGSVLVIDPVC
ncbi:hypothetical protein PTSG_11925 [Salpingoeca rosetta]|uniref:Uncharacterized protein n=1 Tax=Salpingoeca rosetta (strain ATCC 50818 / BSB-021) TaxID=946362 RepID=F2U3D1_SALR5|nr:uncharacterized protein PTSG_11925 [Salpingoeca rosetta]EGD82125.1 hypothetical protein PTSG_11925 [Salpingoeca rosetta]|eukprot:XP_004996308.1 hypothetical protein PTSG_11925 [Salpingoeca rosetta]